LLPDSNWMKTKRLPWQWLEGAAGSGAVWKKWERNCGAELETARHFLIRSGRQAETYPCTDAMRCQCHHKVVFLKSGEIVACCRCDEFRCEPIPVTAEDIELWEVDLLKLTRALARACDAEPMPDGLKMQGTMQIGACSSAAVPLVLTMQFQQWQFQDAVKELVLRLRSPFILFTPTLRFCDALCVERLASVGAKCFDLASHVTVSESGKLRLVKPIELPSIVNGNGDAGLLLREIKQEIAAVRTDYHELRRENNELRQMHAQGLMKFATRVEGDDFRAFAVIMALGNRKAAADFLDVPFRTFYDRIEKWNGLSRDYQRMYRMVEWRKKSGRKLKVRLEDSVAFGDSGGNPENPQTVREVLSEIKDGAADNRDYPALLRDLLEMLANQNAKNWHDVRDEAVEILTEEVPQ